MPTAERRKDPMNTVFVRQAMSAVVVCGTLLGCSSGLVNVSPLPPLKYEVLGKA